MSEAHREKGGALTVVGGEEASAVEGRRGQLLGLDGHGDGGVAREPPNDGPRHVRRVDASAVREETRRREGVERVAAAGPDVEGGRRGRAGGDEAAEEVGRQEGGRVRPEPHGAHAEGRQGVHGEPRERRLLGLAGARQAGGE